jgi:formamidopyrimidine-DNA glycosylase
MPELPDIVAYQEAISRVALGEVLQRIRIYRPFLVRSVQPDIKTVEGKRLQAVERLGKRIVLCFEDELFLVIHLMIAGRFQWTANAPLRPAKTDLAAFEFQSGVLVLTEAGSKKRASLMVVQGRDQLETLSRGGIDPLTATIEQFQEVLRSENRTLKRVLTSPDKFSGIGNAYSDEILFAAKLSPVRLSRQLSDDEAQRLYVSTKETLERWIEILREQFGDKFPGRGQITAFRKDFFVHGRFGEPCRVCGMPIQRIVHAENETNYCARCQNEDRVLADRALSRLLKEDWPRTIEEMSGD